MRNPNPHIMPLIKKRTLELLMDSEENTVKVVEDMPVAASKNAAEPITGGMICPPVEAAASTAPANSGS